LAKKSAGKFRKSNKLQISCTRCVDSAGVMSEDAMRKVLITFDKMQSWRSMFLLALQP
jgi:hypothetical protein